MTLPTAEPAGTRRPSGGSCATTKAVPTDSNTSMVGISRIESRITALLKDGLADLWPPIRAQAQERISWWVPGAQGRGYFNPLVNVWALETRSAQAWTCRLTRIGETTEQAEAFVNC